MSQILQVVLDREECCKILAQHVVAQLPPETKAIAEVVFWGRHGRQKTTPTVDMKKLLLQKHLGQEATKEEEDLRLLEVGAIVTLHPPETTE